MKNKKGKKATQTAKAVQNAALSTKAVAAKAKAAEEKRLAKKAEEAAKKEEALLLGRVVQKPQVVAAGVDPASVLCIYFKKGHCANGTKCKFSHDPSVEHKAAKRDMYTDQRDLEEKKDEDTMDSWDEKTLAEAVAKKAVTNKKANPTAKICKNFIKAIEDRKYGWFCASLPPPLPPLLLTMTRGVPKR